VVLHDPPISKVSTPPPEPQAAASDSSDDGSSLGGAMLHAFFASGHGHKSPAESKPAPAPPPTTGPTKTDHATSQPAGAVPAVNFIGRFTLSDGDVLQGKLMRWSDQTLAVQLTTFRGQIVQIPASAVLQIWAGTPVMVDKARALTVEPGPEDIAFVQKADDVIAVKGLVIGVDNSSLLFRFGDTDRKIGLVKIVGLLLRGNAPKPITAFHQLVKTDSGDTIAGTWTGIDGDSAVITTPFGAAVKVPLSMVYAIEFVNGRVVYLSDLTATRVEQTPYFGRVMPYRLDHSLTGGPLVMSDGNYSKGIAVHSRCVLEYDVSGGFDRFKTRLGFEDPAGRQGRVTARVLGDGKVLYENADARGDQKPVDIDVALNGIRTLTLEIDFGKDQDVGDRVIWAMARLVRAKLPQ
jgi:hypothetical protein